METPPGVGILIVLACLTNLIHSLPTDTNIDCQTGSTVQLGAIDEHYGADIEYGQIISTPDIPLELVPTCARCDEFLEFIYIQSVPNITVRAKKQLDAEALRETLGVLSYNIICTANGVTNRRTLTVRDLNDHKPVFDKEEYRANVPETLPVGEDVVEVNAVDADLTEANRRITYSIQPPSTVFEVKVYGKILLKERLNYTVSSQYDFTVKAQDAGGLSNETRVIINIIDDLTPQFEYDLYEASIQENQVVPVLEVQPAPIKANTTGNYTIIYSIGEVSPSDYWSNFTVDQSTGVITVITELNFEEIKDPITIHIKASLETDLTRTSNTTVMVHVDNVNEAPVFRVKLYTAEIFSVAPPHFQVIQVKATDPDEGDSERLHYSLVTSSSIFAVKPSSGQVYVAGSVADESGMVTLQVKAEDSHGLYDTTTVEVTIKESASSDVVVISLNQEIGAVQNKSLEMEEALERALGWSVNIISVSSSKGGLSRTIEIHAVQEKDTPRTYVSFIATETNGTNVIPKDTVQNKLLDDEEKVLVEMQEVFGADVQLHVEIAGSDANDTVILGVAIGLPLVCIFGGLAAFFEYKRRQSKENTDNNSGREKPDFASDNNSGREKPDFALSDIPSGNSRGNRSSAEWEHPPGKQQGTNAECFHISHSKKQSNASNKKKI